MSNFIDRFISKRYINSWLILCGDIFISVISTLLACIITKYFVQSFYLSSNQILSILILCLIVSIISFYLFKTYRSIIRYSTFSEIANIGLSVIFKCVLLYVAVMLMGIVHYSNPILLIIILDFFFTLILLISMRVVMIVAYETYRRRMLFTSTKNVLIYGVGDISVSIKSRLQNGKSFRVSGFIVHNSNMMSYRLASLPIYNFHSNIDISHIIDHNKIEGIIFPNVEIIREEKDRLVSYCESNRIKIYISPPVDEIHRYGGMNSNIREVNIEDLLGRKEIQINMNVINATFQHKTVLVTGAAGSIGSELCRQIATTNVNRLILFDTGETPIHYIRLELEANYPYLKFIPIIGDVRNKRRLQFAFEQYCPDVVFHAAAYKHVPLMEDNPCEAITTNVLGTKNVAECSLQFNVEKMVMISTDKAVNPTNIMGASKRLAEIYVQSLGNDVISGKISGKTRFITTRFGNVLGSNGSVIPRFREQIANGGPVTVTHPDITRYFMTIPEACRLVLEAATMGHDDEIFVFDMGEPVKIADMARHMIELAGYRPDIDIKIEFIGLRPGEKLYEEVLSDKENTIVTGNKDIRIAKARTYDFDSVKGDIDQIIQYAQNINIPLLVHKIREIEPEYKAQNTWLEKV